MNDKKKIPIFDNEDQERDFWKKSESISFSKLKPSTKTISLRIPEYILGEIKLLVHKRDIPYQSLIKIFLKDRIDIELGNTH